MRRRMRWIGGAILLVCSLLLTSCWDERSIQETNYFTCLGIDYDPGSHIYSVDGALINMKDLAKPESGAGSGPTPSSYVGHGKGQTVHLALEDMYKSSQLIPTLDHLMTVIVTAPTLSHMDNVLDGLNRSRAVRYNVNIMATSEKPEEILSSDALFESPLYSYLYQHQPKGPNKPTVTLLNLQSFVRTYHDQVNTTLIPNLRLNAQNWNYGTKHAKFLMYDGAFMIVKGKGEGYLSENELAGVRWIRSRMTSAFLKVNKEAEVYAVLVVSKHSHKVKYVQGKEGGQFILQVKLDAFIHEQLQAISDKDLRQLTEEDVNAQIKEAIALGKAKGIDLFNLEETVYRFHSGAWKRLKAKGTMFEQLPIRTEVRVHITNTGKLKMMGDGNTWRKTNAQK